MSNQKNKTLHSLLESMIEGSRDKFYRAYSSWNFKSIDKFIVSFEKLTESENKINARKYGNIAKKISSEILQEDSGTFDFENKKRYDTNKVLNEIKLNKPLYKKFKTLYEEIIKRNYWKLQMPLISENYDLLLDRFNNDYDRFGVIHRIFILGESVDAKNVKTKDRIKIKIEDIGSSYEMNEVEKVFYSLINKIKRKTGGKEFLNKYDGIIPNLLEKSGM